MDIPRKLYELASFMKSDSFIHFFLSSRPEKDYRLLFDGVRRKLTTNAQRAISNNFQSGYQSITGMATVPILHARTDLADQIIKLAKLFNEPYCYFNMGHTDLLDAVFSQFNHSVMVDLHRKIINNPILNVEPRNMPILIFITDLGVFVDCIMGLNRRFCMVTARTTGTDTPKPTTDPHL